jgi:hypothetical protein
LLSFELSSLILDFFRFLSLDPPFVCSKARYHRGFGYCII